MQFTKKQTKKQTKQTKKQTKQTKKKKKINKQKKPFGKVFSKKTQNFANPAYNRVGNLFCTAPQFKLNFLQTSQKKFKCSAIKI